MHAHCSARLGSLTVERCGFSFSCSSSCLSAPQSLYRRGYGRGRLDTFTAYSVCETLRQARAHHNRKYVQTGHVTMPARTGDAPRPEARSAFSGEREPGRPAGTAVPVPFKPGSSSRCTPPPSSLNREVSFCLGIPPSTTTTTGSSSSSVPLLRRLRHLLAAHSPRAGSWLKRGEPWWRPSTRCPCAR